MKYTSIQELQEALEQGGYRHAGEEQDKLEELLTQAGSFRSEFSRWVFGEYVGFVDTRKQAGLYYMDENRDEAMRIVERLIHSNDPDDRDTASEVLQAINVPSSYELIRNLLRDPYPYLQFDACDFLSEKYPNEVKETLIKLTSHEDERVRKTARNDLRRLFEK